MTGSDPNEKPPSKHNEESDPIEDNNEEDPKDQTPSTTTVKPDKPEQRVIDEDEYTLDQLLDFGNIDIPQILDGIQEALYQLDFDKAQDLLNSLDPYLELLTSFEKAKYDLYRAKILSKSVQIAQLEESIYICMDMVSDIMRTDLQHLSRDNLQLLLESFINITHVNLHLGHLENARESVIELDRIINAMEVHTLEVDELIISYYYYVKARYLNVSGDYETAMFMARNSLKIREKMNYNQLTSDTIQLAGTILIGQGELDDALDYFKRSFSQKVQLRDRLGMARSLQSMAQVHLLRGEISDAQALFTDGIKFFRETGNVLEEALSFISLGLIQVKLGNLDEGIAQLNMALGIFEELSNKLYIAHCLYELIRLSLPQDIANASNYLAQLKIIDSSIDSPLIHQKTVAAEARIMSYYPRKVYAFRAMEKLESVLQEDISDYVLLTDILLLQCDLLFMEYSTFGGQEPLIEIDIISENIREIAKRQQTKLLQIDVLLIRARLVLIRDLDIDEVQRILNQAQFQADKLGLVPLSKKIASQYDYLLRYIDEWRQVQSLVSDSKGGKTSYIEGRIHDLMQKEIILSDEIEVPMYLGIWLEEGISVFQNNFGMELPDMDDIEQILSDLSQKYGEKVLYRDKVQNYKLITIRIPNCQLLLHYIFTGRLFDANNKVNELVKFLGTLGITDPYHISTFQTDIEDKMFQVFLDV